MVGMHNRENNSVMRVRDDIFQEKPDYHPHRNLENIKTFPGCEDVTHLLHTVKALSSQYPFSIFLLYCFVIYVPILNEMAPNTRL